MFLLASPAFCEDGRLGDLIHLVVAADKCDLNLNASATNLIRSVQSRVDDHEAKIAMDSTKILVEKDFSKEGAATFCWNTWDKLKDAGFL